MTTTAMRVAVRVAVMAGLGAALVPAAGCGSGPSCDQAVANAARLRDLPALEAKASIARCKQEAWSEALRGCVAGAQSTDELDACARERSSVDSYRSYMKKSKAIEAELQLKRIEKELKRAYAENASFPQGEAGPTPEPGSCCAGPGHKCQPDPSLWSGVAVWDALDFEMDDPHLFSYSYRSPKYDHAEVEAIGDLDCDSIMATYTLICDAATGSPSCTLTRPDHAD